MPAGGSVRAWLKGVQAVAQLQEREAKAPGAQLPNRESKEWFEYQHLWSNVEKTVQVTDGILQVSAHRRLSLIKPWVVGQLDHAQAQVPWAEGSDHQVEEHSDQHIRQNAPLVWLVTPADERIRPGARRPHEDPGLSWPG